MKGLGHNAGALGAVLDVAKALNPENSTGERIHGGAGATIWAVTSLAGQPEIALTYTAVDRAASNTQYINDDGSITRGYPAVGLYIEDLHMRDPYVIGNP